MRRVDPLGGQYGPLFIERGIGVTHHIDGMGERRLDATTCPDQTQMIPSVFLLDALRYVRFTPEGGHVRSPLWANSGH